MASKIIETTASKTKGIRHKARIRETLMGVVVGEVSRIFDKKNDAQAWADKTAKLVERYGVECVKQTHHIKRVTIADAIRAVINNEPTASNLGRSKLSNLKRLEKSAIARIAIDELSETDLFRHCQSRLEDGVKPQTIAHDISNLSTTLSDAATFYQYPKVGGNTFSNTRTSLQRHEFIARSEERTRLPKQYELDLIAHELGTNSDSTRVKLPLNDIRIFAEETAMRRGEITKSTWGDVDWSNRTITVRDRKHPNKKKRHSDLIPLSALALNVLRDQPKGQRTDRIFPYPADAISSEWRKLMNKLGIVDLRFHDLRAHAACKMFRAGKSAEQISKITGHRDINILNNVYLRLSVNDLRAA